jgi:hypothetical protein
MIRRKGERTAPQNERECPRIVEVKMPPYGLGAKLDLIHEFHRKRGLDVRYVKVWSDIFDCSSRLRNCHLSIATRYSVPVQFHLGSVNGVALVRPKQSFWAHRETDCWLIYFRLPHGRPNLVRSRH